MLMLNNGGAQILCTVPDVCKVPAPPAPPIPTPFPNIGMSSMCLPIVPNVLVTGMPSINISSKILLSNGDQAGLLLGAKSNMIMGEIAFTKGSKGVMVGGKPALMQGGATTHNMQNTNGLASIPPPGQISVMVNS